MSLDREEIRWKFQVMLENLEMVRDDFDNERKFIDERHQKLVHEIEKMRNYWFMGIGFFMSFFTSIILAKNLDSVYFVYPVVAGIGGLIIFFITNIKLVNLHAIFKEIDDVYYVILKTTLIPLKGMISTYALIDDFSKEDAMLLVTYVTIVGKVISFKLIQYMDEKLNLRQFKLDDYRRHYEFAKSNLDKFKEQNYALGADMIEEFIKEFEKKDKKKSKDSK